jgi:hypothetical protein
MPEKTHGRAGESCSALELLLELRGRFVAKRRVQAAAIIVLFDEGFDVRAQVIEIHIIVGVDLFPLERLHKTLTTGVVVRVGQPTHARNHLTLRGLLACVLILYSTFGLRSGSPPDVRFGICCVFLGRCRAVLASEVRDQKINSFLTFRRRVFQTKNRKASIICP